MMKYFPLFALVLCAAGFAVVQGDCASELLPCTRTFTSTAGTSVATYCAALQVYKSCFKAACDEVSPSYIDNKMNEASQQRGIHCGSCMLCVSLMPVLLLAIASLFFNTA
eukprot:TRINITY_DN2201_c0_g1_i13.p1 TRINITY_DN2201_c0_g1~~TRINITY_DN2201_c0_g1_i13.p1  ORF type:complete len:110 (+),score=20.97 TRINITY_DN2201_c0_g1_i13:178-507(+)